MVLELMKASRFIKPGEVRIETVPKPTLEKDTDAVLKIVRASVCGSDLWWYRGISQRPSNSPTGHEAIGIVEQVGKKVTNVQPGDFVIIPFTHGCGHCAACKAGFDGSCPNRDRSKPAAYQAEYLRYENANWGLVKLPGQPDDYSDEMLNSFVTLADVMATGFHAAKSAEVKPQDTVVVIGDGAVGLSGIISAKLLGATRIIAMSRHADRQTLAKEFGASEIIEDRGSAAVAKIMELTNDAGADAILECVGSNESVDTAIAAARPGAVIGRVGIPQRKDLDTSQLFHNNIGLRGGTASVTTYDRELLVQAVLDHKINPGKVFTKSFTLNEIQAAYQAMDQRKAIKSLLIVNH